MSDRDVVFEESLILGEKALAVASKLAADSPIMKEVIAGLTSQRSIWGVARCSEHAVPIIQLMAKPNIRNTAQLHAIFSKAELLTNELQVAIPYLARTGEVAADAMRTEGSLLLQHRNSPLAQLYLQNKDAVVNIDTLGAFLRIKSTGGLGFALRQRSEGTGVIHAGRVITNYHVASGDNTVKTVMTLNDGRRFDLDLLGQDKNADLAVFRILNTQEGEHFPSVQLAKHSWIPRNAPVIMLGKPVGVKQSVLSTGVVTRSYIRGISEIPDGSFATSNPLYPGSSGSIALNQAGEGIGIANTYIPKEEPTHIIERVGVIRIEQVCALLAESERVKRLGHYADVRTQWNFSTSPTNKFSGSIKVLGSDVRPVNSLHDLLRRLVPKNAWTEMQDDIAKWTPD